MGSGGDFLGTAQTQRESHLNRQESPELCGSTKLPSVAAPSVPRSPKTLRHSDLGPAQPAGLSPHVPGDLPPTPGAGRGGAAAAGPHGPGSSNNGPSSSRFLLLPGVDRRHHPGRLTSTRGMELPGEAAAAERRRRAWIYRAYVSSPQQELHKAGAVIRLSSILARSPRWVLQRDDAISPDFVVALSWWARWGALEEKKIKGWER